MEALAAAAFVAGLLGGVHCAGMCGGIVGTLALQSRGPLLARQLGFNAGRIASYVAAGTVFGLAGGFAQMAGPVVTMQTAMFAAANALMVLLGLYVAGWGAAMQRFEAAGAHLWRRVQPVARTFLPIDSPRRAIAAGVLWGWVPCGLVYSMLALAMASGSAHDGAFVMLAFGLGTLPNLLAAGMAAQKLFAIRRAPWIRRVAGLLIVVLGAIGLARVPGLREAILAGWHCIA
jgi:uncharacterized protein